MTRLAPSRAAKQPSAFTLTELAVVIAIIVLILAMAVPAFNYITGSRSVDGAQNQLSALIGRFRTEAIGLQKVRGLFFYVDASSGRVTAAEVGPTSAIAGDDATVDIFLDLVADRDSIALPPGISIQTLDDGFMAGGVRQDDGYIGFNTINRTTSGNATVVPYGGVILFDSAGRLINQRYAFRAAALDSGSVLRYTSMGKLLYNKPTKLPTDTMDSGDVDVMPCNFNIVTNPSIRLRSSVGFTMFPIEPFTSAGYTLEDVQVTIWCAAVNTAYTTTTTEKAEEDWLDQNSTPVLINRYNGRLIRGE